MVNKTMAEEFKKTGPATVSSTEGFSVEVKFAGGVVYHDDVGEVYIGSEWLLKPSFRIIIYKTSHANTGLDNRNQTQIDAIFENVSRALSFLGYTIEIEK